MAVVRTYPAGVPSRVDLQAYDVEQAERFYGELLGWTFADVTPPGAPFRYAIAQLDGQDVAGVAGPAGPADPQPAPASWATYVAVDDAAATVGRVTEAGGRVLSPPEPAGESGVSAVCADPEGVEFRLWQAKRRPGAQLTNIAGTWNFSDLHTADAGAARAFYTAVFGWTFDDVGFAVMIRRLGYGDHLASTIDPGIHDRQRGMAPPGFADAIGCLAPAQDGDRPHWHVTISVADRDHAVATATRLGGTMVTTSESQWNKGALIRDPQGAEFTASQFTPPAS